MLSVGRAGAGASHAISPQQKLGSFIRAYSSSKRRVSVSADMTEERRERREEKKDDMFFNECGAV
jgi:hypothetical protein